MIKDLLGEIIHFLLKTQIKYMGNVSKKIMLQVSICWLKNLYVLFCKEAWG